MTISIDCETPEQIKEVQKLAQHFPITEKYKKLDCPLPNETIENITYGKWGRPTLHFENEYSICLQHCAWRLEKGNDYLEGNVDCPINDEDNKIKKLSELIGKKIHQIDIANPMMDARFQFDDHYVLKTFTRKEEITQWLILSKSVPIFEAKLQSIAPKDEVLKSFKNTNIIDSNEYQNDQADAALEEIQKRIGKNLSKVEKDNFYDYLAHKQP